MAPAISSSCLVGKSLGSVSMDVGNTERTLARTTSSGKLPSPVDSGPRPRSPPRLLRPCCAAPASPYCQPSSSVI